MTTLPPRPFNGARWLVRATLAVLTVLTILAFATFDSRSVDVGTATVDFLAGFQRLLLEPRLENVTIVELLEQLAITVALGALTTLIGAVVAFVLALGVARNLAPRWLSVSINAVTALVRAVPTVLWVLLFAVSAGLGSVAAVIGMSFHSAGYLIKAYAESFEEIELGTLESASSVGTITTGSVSSASVSEAHTRPPLP